MNKFDYQIIGNELLSPTCISLTLQAMQKNNGFQHTPGQYAGISFMEGINYSPVRSFSIASSPNQTDILQFGIRKAGNYTQTLASLPIGTPMTVYGPFGHFTLENNPQIPHVFLVGGIGITPFMSMIRYATEMRLPIPLILLYSNRTRSDIPFIEEIKEAARVNPYFKYVSVLSQDTSLAPEDSEMLLGRLDTNIIHQAVANLKNPAKYLLCGPPMFMNAMIDNLHQLGIPDSQIQLEAFSQVPAAQKTAQPWNKIVYTASILTLLAAGVAIAAKDTNDYLARQATSNSTNASTASNTTSQIPLIVPTSTPNPTYSTPYPTYTPIPTPYYQPRSRAS